MHTLSGFDPSGPVTFGKLERGARLNTFLFPLKFGEGLNRTLAPWPVEVSGALALWPA